MLLAVLTELWGEWVEFLLFFDGLGEGKGGQWEALNENIFRNHSLGKNRCCSLAVRAKPPVWFSDISGNKWPRQVQHTTITMCMSNQSRVSPEAVSEVCVSPGAAGGVGKVRGVRGHSATCRGTPRPGVTA